MMNTAEIMARVMPGLRGFAELQVSTRDLANHVKSGEIPVLATPTVLTLMEMACLDAIRGRLPETHQSLGTKTSFNHFAPTPSGMYVYAEAQIRSVSGRDITFYVKARDEREDICAGMLERHVVEVARFIDKVRAKQP